MDVSENSDILGVPRFLETPIYHTLSVFGSQIQASVATPGEAPEPLEPSSGSLQHDTAPDFGIRRRHPRGLHRKNVVKAGSKDLMHPRN